MHKGMSKLTPYKNHQCTKELDYIDGKYVYDYGNISKNVNRINAPIYIKNNGSHKAYGVSIMPKEDNLIASVVKQEIRSGEAVLCMLTIDVGTLTSTSFEVYYDSI